MQLSGADCQPPVIYRDGAPPDGTQLISEQSHGWLETLRSSIPRPSVQVRCSAVVVLGVALSVLPSLAAGQAVYDPNIGEAEVVDRSDRPVLERVMELACIYINRFNPQANGAWSFTPFWNVQADQGDFGQAFCGTCTLRATTRADNDGQWITLVKVEPAHCGPNNPYRFITR